MYKPNTYSKARLMTIGLFLWVKFKNIEMKGILISNLSRKKINFTFKSKYKKTININKSGSNEFSEI